MAQNKETVYHGTTTAAAANIRKEQHFRKSEEEDDWLGSGVYFFPYPGLASGWTKGRGDVVSATLEYDDKQLLDLDDPDKLKELNRAMDGLMEEMTRQGKIRLGAKNEKQLRWCLSCNIYRKMNRDIGVITYTFHRHNPPGSSGFSINARQICVSKDELITKIT